MNSSLYLALGDSLTKGYGVGTRNSFATLYYNEISKVYPDLEYINAGVNGIKSGELANLVRKPEYIRCIACSRIITLTIGSNDLLAIGKGLLTGTAVNIDQILRNLNRNLMAIANNIRLINSHAIIKIATIYNPLSRSNPQVRHLSYKLIRAVNMCIERIAKQFQMIVVPIDKAFWKREDMFLGEHLHPNIIGYRVMAEMFLTC